METTTIEPEVLIPDEVIDTRFRSPFENGHRSVRTSDAPTPLSRRQRFAATLLLIVLAIGALAVASLVAVGAIIVAVVLFVVGLIARLAIAISGKTTG